MKMMMEKKPKKVKFKPRQRKNELSYKLGKYVLDNPQLHSRSIHPYRIEARCEIPRLKLDRAYSDSYLSGAFSVIKEINHRLELPINPKDVKRKVVLWVIKNRKVEFLTVGYSLDKLSDLVLFFNKEEPLLLKAIEELEKTISFPKGSLDGRKKLYIPKKKNLKEIVTYFELPKVDSSII